MADISKAPKCLSTQKHFVDLSGPNKGKCRICGEEIKVGAVKAVAVSLDFGGVQVSAIDQSSKVLDQVAETLHLYPSTSARRKL